MDLGYYFTILWRRKWVIISALVSALAMVAVGNHLTTRIYTATATLRVAASVQAINNPTLHNYKDALMNTYVQVATSQPVLMELKDRLKADPSKTMNVKVEIIPNTELISITVTDQNAQFATQAANILAQILIEQKNQLYLGSGLNSQDILAGQLEQSKVELDKMQREYEKLIVRTPAASAEINLMGQFLSEKQRSYEILLRQYEQAQYQYTLDAGLVTLVEEASVPVVPSQPRTLMNYLMALIIALPVGLVLALLFENMDDHMYVTHDIEITSQSPTLAKLPKASVKHLNISKNGSSPLAESIRHLAARLDSMSEKPQHTVLLLAGAEPGQGATTTIANLGYALAAQGKNIVMVDCNFRDPKLHNLFDLPNEQGVVDILSGVLDLKLAVQKTGDKRLSLLASGPVAGLESPVLDSAHIASLISTLRQQFDYVLIDAPALTMADIVSIAPHVDELILVARRSHVKRESVQSAGEYLSRFKNKFVGLIVNEAEKQFAYSYTYVASDVL